jgi:hypothetical protein
LWKVVVFLPHSLSCSPCVSIAKYVGSWFELYVVSTKSVSIVYRRAFASADDWTHVRRVLSLFGETLAAACLAHAHAQFGTAALLGATRYCTAECVRLLLDAGGDKEAADGVRIGLPRI